VKSLFDRQIFLDRHMLMREYIFMLATLVALAEPNRLRIVELLRTGAQPVGDIADNLGLRQPQTSKHLNVLREAGLVTVTPDAQRRLYELRPEAFHDLDAWLEPYRHFWEQRLDALERRLENMPAEPQVRKETEP
jgi:DNA-binding transcriptional ArsR family regulator